MSRLRFEPDSILPGETLEREPFTNNVDVPESDSHTSFSLSPLTSAHHSDLQVLPIKFVNTLTKASVEFWN